MKHLLIILSFILLSSPVIGQETGVLYQYETSSGIQWKTFGDGKVQPKYTGEIKNGIMDGLGVLIYPYGGKSVVGEWKNGKEWNTKHTKKDGTIVVKYAEGLKTFGVLYSCYLNNDFIFADDADYCKEGTLGNWLGEIMNKKPHGDGVYFDENGNKFVGEWKNGFAWNVKLYGTGGGLGGVYVKGKYIPK